MLKKSVKARQGTGSKALLDGGAGVLKLFDNLGNALNLTIGLLILFKKNSIQQNLLQLKDSLSVLITNIRAYASGQSAANVQMDVGAGKAITLGAAMNTALGVIGLVITGLSLLKIGIDNISRSAM